jgi:hypothetical protein
MWLGDTGAAQICPCTPRTFGPSTPLRYTVLRLPTTAARSGALARALRWLSDEDLYRALGKPTRLPRPASVSPEDEEVMEKLGRYAAVEEAVSLMFLLFVRSLKEEDDTFLSPC